MIVLLVYLFFALLGLHVLKYGHMLLSVHQGHSLKMSNFATDVLNRYGYTPGWRYCFFIAQLLAMVLGVIAGGVGAFQFCSACMVTNFLLLTIECRLVTRLCGKQWTTAILNIMLFLWMVGYIVLFILAVSPHKYALWLEVHGTWVYGKVLVLAQFILALFCFVLVLAVRSILVDFEFRQKQYAKGEANSYNGHYYSKKLRHRTTKWFSKILGQKLGKRFGDWAGDHRQRFLLRRWLIDDKKVTYLLREEESDFEV